MHVASARSALSHYASLALLLVLGAPGCVLTSAVGAMMQPHVPARQRARTVGVSVQDGRRLVVEAEVRATDGETQARRVRFEVVAERLAGVVEHRLSIQPRPGSFSPILGPALFHRDDLDVVLEGRRGREWVVLATAPAIEVPVAFAARWAWYLLYCVAAVADVALLPIELLAQGIVIGFD